MKNLILTVFSILLLVNLMILGMFEISSKTSKIFTEDIPKSWSIPSESKI
ncbi:MAG: hypothetical protein U9Q80_08135 [Bacillota bacterium]|nr:hypothetical protein [Bacillota bacterium]